LKRLRHRPHRSASARFHRTSADGTGASDRTRKSQEGPNGPRIDLAFALGLIGAVERRDLDFVRKIRDALRMS
jgi:hypothetical protein